MRFSFWWRFRSWSSGSDMVVVFMWSSLFPFKVSVTLRNRKGHRESCLVRKRLSHLYNRTLYLANNCYTNLAKWTGVLSWQIYYPPFMTHSSVSDLVEHTWDAQHPRNWRKQSASLRFYCTLGKPFLIVARKGVSIVTVVAWSYNHKPMFQHLLCVFKDIFICFCKFKQYRTIGKWYFCSCVSSHEQTWLIHASFQNISLKVAWHDP